MGSSGGGNDNSVGNNIADGLSTFLGTGTGDKQHGIIGLAANFGKWLDGDANKQQQDYDNQVKNNAQTDQDQQIAAANTAAKNNDINASMNAQAIRAAAQAKAAGGTPYVAPAAASMTKDFLGL